MAPPQQRSPPRDRWRGSNGRCSLGSLSSISSGMRLTAACASLSPSADTKQANVAAGRRRMLLVSPRSMERDQSGDQSWSTLHGYDDQAGVRACVRACVHACVPECMRACVRASGPKRCSLTDWKSVHAGIAAVRRMTQISCSVTAENESMGTTALPVISCLHGPLWAILM